MERRVREMRVPQMIIIVLYGLNLGINLSKHGEVRNDKYNFWSSLLAFVIVFAVLRWGGFFC